jgi:3',5'-cyclic AMP phosphodiesterase CpdA
MRRHALILWAACGIALFGALLGAAAGRDDFHFVLLGDRTGDTQLGRWEQVWKEAGGDHPPFVLTVGDSIEGHDNAKAEAEWREFQQTIVAYRKIPLYLTPGNHDIWSPESEALYRKYSRRPPHYGFDYGKAHFTVLNNSGSDTLPASEVAFLESDLRAHAAASPKFVVMHRPSWLADAALHNSGGALPQLAKRYNVRYWIAGHVHQLIHTSFDGATYYAAPSAGGHLRLSGKYEDGWFFGWTHVDVRGGEASFQVHETGGRTTPLSDWGLAGLLKR